MFNLHFNARTPNQTVVISPISLHLRADTTNKSTPPSNFVGPVLPSVSLPSNPTSTSFSSLSQVSDIAITLNLLLKPLKVIFNFREVTVETPAVKEDHLKTLHFKLNLYSEYHLTSC